MVHTEVAETIKLGLEATVYESPDAEGLSRREIIELCERFGFREGEILDALGQLQNGQKVEEFFRHDLITLPQDYIYFLVAHFGFKEEDPRNLRLMAGILQCLEKDAKDLGRGNVSISVSTLARRLAEEFQVSEQDVRVHIRLLEKYRCFSISGDYIEKPNQNSCSPKFVESISAGQREGRRDGRRFAQIRGTVREIISRRNSGKPISTDPIKAFEEKFDLLKAKPLYAWWNAMVAEWKDLDDRRNSVSVLTLSASLCEGALAFFAASGIHSGLTMTQKLPSDPRQWKLEALISAASTGGTTALLVDPLRQRLVELNERRKALHPGSFIQLSIPLQKVPEIRPEQAVEARSVVHLLLRTIVDWLARNITVQNES